VLVSGFQKKRALRRDSQEFLGYVRATGFNGAGQASIAFADATIQLRVGEGPQPVEAR
jgi:hypothetical protein